MSNVDEVRDRLDIVEIVGETVQLKRAGRSWKGTCPFHQEKTPSFVVFPDSGNWRCFGSCATGGDVFDFVMRVENIDFKGALEILARRAGVELAPPSPDLERRKELRDRLREATAAAAEFFQHQLLRSEEPGAAAAREYLAKRGFGGEACKAHAIGYAPDEWQRTGDALRRQGFDDELLLAAGLLRQRDDGNAYDYFRGRVTFTIHSLRGEAIAFGARTLDPEGVPKYLNSPQTEIFDKGRTLYGLDRAKKAVRDAGEVVVVEGYTDVVRAHAAGFENVVASLGTALTEHHVLLLKRFTPRIVLALDADAAGQSATLRGLEVAQEAAGGDVVPVPTARGVVRYEHRMDVELAVATLPEGRDPDDVIREDPEAWRALIAGARPVMQHLFTVLTAELDLSDPRGKTTAVDRLMPVIADIPEPVARAAWVSRLADLVRIDERTLAGSLARAAAAKKRRPTPRRGAEDTGRAQPGSRPGSRASSERGAGSNRERDPNAPPDGPTSFDLEEGAPPLGEADLPAGLDGAIGFIPEERRSARPASTPTDLAAWLMGQFLLAPHRLPTLNSALRDEELPPLTETDLERAVDRDLLVAVGYAAHGVAPPDAPPEHRLEALPESHAAYAAGLRKQAVDAPVLDELDCRRALRRALLRLRIQATKSTLEGLRFLQAESEADERSALDDRVRQVTLDLASLQGLLTPRGRARGKRDRAVG